MASFSNFVICAVFLNCYAAANKIHSISLKRKDSVLTTMMKESVHPKVIKSLLRNDGEMNSSIPLFANLWTNDYYAQIYLGQPGQKFSVSFDTAWSDSWVPSSNCSFWSIGCKLRNKYDENKSRSSIKTPYNFNVNIGGSALVGKVFYDLLNLNGVNISGQSFAAVSEIPSVFALSTFDGIFGMSLGYYNLIVPVMWNLKKQKIIDQLVFSFHLNRDGGSIVMGGVDPAHYKGNFTYFKVVESNPPQWMIQADSVTLTRNENETASVCQSGCKVVMSTGGSQIYGPSQEIAAIHKFIKAKNYLPGIYTVNCADVPKLPNITLSFGNTPYVLEGKDYTYRVDMTMFYECVTTFSSNYDDKDENWYVGGAFMSRYYTTFDMMNGRIGFATAK